MKVVFCLILALAVVSCLDDVAVSDPIDVFKAGEGGYMCIRIPVVLQTPKGLVAMAEGRGLHSNNYNCCVTPVEDFPWCTDKDLVMKVSTDGGNEWTPLIVVFETNSQYFFSNPTPVYYNGYLYMIYTRCAIANLYSNCEVFFAVSAFENQWTVAQSFATPPDAPLGGPGPGLLVQQSMLFPIATTDGNYAIHINTNNIANLTKGGVVPGGVSGESQMAVLPNSQLVIQMRSGTYHYFANSNDNGQTWSTATAQKQLPATNCQASLFYSSTAGALLYSTPAANIDSNRSNVTIYASTDGGNNFAKYALVYDGPSAYSSLFQSTNGTIGILFERGEKSPYEVISLSFVNQ